MSFSASVRLMIHELLSEGLEFAAPEMKVDLRREYPFANNTIIEITEPRTHIIDTVAVGVQFSNVK
ncbi:hypothetical protein C9975_11650, partial [Thalassospira xiamenensis]